MLLLFFITTIAQTTKGAVESTDVPHPSAHSGNVYALIVGVSNYPYVKPLNFAEEDALLFFEFLRSKAGGEVPENHIKLLLNEQATHANVTAGLAWLNNSLGAQPQDGDRVYIYLSGHGDAYDASEAYYLCYDSNPAGDKDNYQLGGALNIGIMKNRVASMVRKGVEVILVVDACRSGDVPGVRSGIRNPYQSVIEEPVGEVLLLSAGPNQFALEDRRWGGGHGGFTWYLIKGLSGEADVDGDNAVSLFEIESYTKMKVIGDTKQMGAAQTPYVCCNNKFDCVLSKKDEVFSQRIRAEESGNTKVGLTALAARDALEKAMFEKEELKQAYFALKKACKEQRYLGSNSAWSIWEDCKAKYTAQEVEPIRMYLMGALAAEGQKAINEEMNVSIGESPGYSYYHKRREWLEHAVKLQQEKNEVLGLSTILSFTHALELSASVLEWNMEGDSILYLLPDGVHKDKSIAPYLQADSIFKVLEKDFSNSAVFYYLLQAHQNKEEFFLKLDPNVRKRNILKSIELAPHWIKPLEAAMMMDIFSSEELSEKLSKIKWVSSESAEYSHVMGRYKVLKPPFNFVEHQYYLDKAFAQSPTPYLLARSIQYEVLKYDMKKEVYSNGVSDIVIVDSDDWNRVKKKMDILYEKIRNGENVSESSDYHNFLLRPIYKMATTMEDASDMQRWLEIQNDRDPTTWSLAMEYVIDEYLTQQHGRALHVDSSMTGANLLFDEGVLDMLQLSHLQLSEHKRMVLNGFYKFFILRSFHYQNCRKYRPKEWKILVENWINLEWEKWTRQLGTIQDVALREQIKNRVWIFFHDLRIGYIGQSNEILLDGLLKIASAAEIPELIHALTLQNEALKFLLEDSLLTLNGESGFFDSYITILGALSKQNQIAVNDALLYGFNRLKGDKRELIKLLNLIDFDSLLVNASFFYNDLLGSENMDVKLDALELLKNWGHWTMIEKSIESTINEILIMPNRGHNLPANTGDILRLTNLIIQSEALLKQSDYINQIAEYIFNVHNGDFSEAQNSIRSYFKKLYLSDDRKYWSKEKESLYKQYVVE